MAEGMKRVSVDVVEIARKTAAVAFTKHFQDEVMPRLQRLGEWEQRLLLVEEFYVLLKQHCAYLEELADRAYKMATDAIDRQVVAPIIVKEASRREQE